MGQLIQFCVRLCLYESLGMWLWADAYLHLKGWWWSKVNFFFFFFNICWQVQLEPTSSWALLRNNMSGTSKYTGMFQATKDIFREEGLPVCWLNLYYIIVYPFSFPLRCFLVSGYVGSIFSFQFPRLISVVCWFFPLATFI
jgi:hypothetical protein